MIPQLFWLVLPSLNTNFAFLSQINEVCLFRNNNWWNLVTLGNGCLTVNRSNFFGFSCQKIDSEKCLRQYCHWRRWTRKGEDEKLAARLTEEKWKYQWGSQKTGAQKEQQNLTKQKFPWVSPDSWYVFGETHIISLISQWDRDSQ